MDNMDDGSEAKKKKKEKFKKAISAMKNPPKNAGEGIEQALTTVGKVIAKRKEAKMAKKKAAKTGVKRNEALSQAMKKSVTG